MAVINMSLFIASSSERRRNLAFAFVFLPGCLAFAAYGALHDQWALALTALSLWIGLLLFSVSHLAQAAAALIVAIGAIASHQWAVAVIALFATLYLAFTIVALRRVPPKEVAERLASLPWLIRPRPFFSNTPDWKAASIGFIIGVGVLTAGIFLLWFKGR